MIVLTLLVFLSYAGEPLYHHTIGHWFDKEQTTCRPEHG